jgi:hypothetical protein
MMYNIMLYVYMYEEVVKIFCYSFSLPLCLILYTIMIVMHVQRGSTLPQRVTH